MSNPHNNLKQGQRLGGYKYSDPNWKPITHAVGVFSSFQIKLVTVFNNGLRKERKSIRKIKCTLIKTFH